MVSKDTGLEVSKPILEQMVQVIIDSYSRTQLDSMFRRAVHVSEHSSLAAAVYDWLEKQLVCRREELLEEVFRVFMKALIQDIGRPTWH